MNPTVLRIVDANLNRAREALRVVEDYARFVLDDGNLCGKLKDLRHELAAATAAWADRAMLMRDTPGDVGTANSTPAEFERPGLAAVVTAAGKRLGEALRTIEEYLKTVSPADAARVELIRYQFYDVELRVARTLHSTERFADVRVYVLITEAVCRRPWLEVAEAAIDGGADCLQLREKELEGGELLRRSRMLVELCRRRGVLCIINDRADVAELANADGVHVGQGDLPAIEARKIVGPDKVVGVSTHDIEQARRAAADGADYVGVGPVFRSATKPREILPGLEFAREVARELSIPAVAIAGITEGNLEQVLETGVRAIAVTAAVAGSDDPRAAAARLKARIVGGPTPGGVDILVCPSTPSRIEEPPAKQKVPDLALPQLKTYSRRLPHWRLDGATYFVTFRIRTGEFRPMERSVILDHVRAGDPKYYTLIAAVVMPDHVHLILRPGEGVELSRIMQGTKGVLAKKINDLRDVRGHVWQDESWDRIVRDQGELDEKVQYCLENSVKKGLAEDPWDYPWWYYKPERK
jgi:thiamine-phosphate pyrophosphorylase